MPAQNVISIFLATTMVTEQWEVELPATVLVQSIIGKLIATPDMPFREQDDNGRRVPYRLMWREGDRVLNETETLATAGVQPHHTLIMTRQARAGQAADAR